MNVIKMVPFGFWIYYNLKVLNVYRKNIDSARKIGDYETERENISYATRDWGEAIAKKIDFDLDVEGNTDFPEGPVLFVSNHQGYGDILAYCVAIKNKQFGFVAKDDLFKIPMFGKWIARIRSINLERKDPRAALRAIDEGVDYLKNGFSLVIFPEGTRSKGNNVGEFKKGSLRLATKAKVPIIPVTLFDTWRVYEEKGYVTSAKAKMFFHDPIETKDMDRKEANNLASVVEDIIRKKLDEYVKEK